MVKSSNGEGGARMARDEAEEHMTYNEWVQSNAGRYTNDRKGRDAKKADWKALQARVQKKKAQLEEKIEQLKQDGKLDARELRLLAIQTGIQQELDDPEPIDWSKELEHALQDGKSIRGIDHRIADATRLAQEKALEEEADRIVAEELRERRREEKERKNRKNIYITIPHTSVTRSTAPYDECIIENISLASPETNGSSPYVVTTPTCSTITTPRNTADSVDCLKTPRTEHRKPKAQKKLKGKAANIVKFMHVDRDHPLYEEKIAWESDEHFNQWYQTQREIDVRDWTAVRLKLERKLAKETDRRSHILNLQVQREREALKAKEAVQEKIRLERALVKQMQELKRVQIEKAKKWFMGNTISANFTAWKSYTAFMISKREETAKTKRKCVQLSFVGLVVCCLLVIGMWLLVNYLEAQRVQHEAQMALEDEIASKSLNKKNAGTTRRARRLLRGGWQHSSSSHIPVFRSTQYIISRV